MRRRCPYAKENTMVDLATYHPKAKEKGHKKNVKFIGRLTKTVESDKDMKNLAQSSRGVTWERTSVDGVSNFCMKECRFTVKLENFQVFGGHPSKEDTDAGHFGDWCICFIKLTRSLIKALCNESSLLFPQNNFSISVCLICINPFQSHRLFSLW